MRRVMWAAQSAMRLICVALGHAVTRTAVWVMDAPRHEAICVWCRRCGRPFYVVNP